VTCNVISVVKRKAARVDSYPRSPILLLSTRIELMSVVFYGKTEEEVGIDLNVLPSDSFLDGRLEMSPTLN
jgi:hypothetical protein